MHDLADKGHVLRKRLDRLMMREFCLPTHSENHPARSSRTRRSDLFRSARPEVARVLGDLEQLGQLALVGGAVRDVARDGVERFRSDLDFVFHNGDLPAYLRLMEKLGAVKNRFGGYRVNVGCARVDIWALEHTWAHVAGYRRVGTVEDVLQCTFFDWDAILYDLPTRKIISTEGYFDLLRSGILDINLRENPNPRGSLVRALRRGMIWRVSFGPALTKFAIDRLSEDDWSDLVALDERAFAKPVLRVINPTLLRQRLANTKLVHGRVASEPFGPSREQLVLPLQS